MAVVSARDAVARMLAGPEPSPGWWRRSVELADEVVAAMAARPVEVARTRPLLERLERRPCAGCGLPIAPGQAYVVNGPYHIGCKKPDLMKALKASFDAARAGRDA